MDEKELIIWSSWMISISLLVGLIGHFFLYRILLWVATRTKNIVDDLCIKHCYRTIQWTIVLLVIRLILPMKFPKEYLAKSNHILSIFLITLVSLLTIKIVYVFEGILLQRFNIETKDNLKARKIRTQLNVLKRIIIIAVCFLALGLILMTFDKVRQLGTTMLASAGIIGIAVGIAAQKTIGTFIAGLQIAFTQPIRLDDVVIVENEWGRIEEITLTYVVVKIWDLRRLVVPITYFIEQPFQNWTRTSADLLGTVYLYVDYTIPLESIREQLNTILKNSERWDGKVSVLQVTNATEKTVEIRALMSAADASIAWELRCEVREKLITFIQENFANTLPVTRVRLEKDSI